MALLLRHDMVVLHVPGNIYERIQNGNPFDWYTTQVFKVAARLSARFCASILVTSQEMWRWWMYTGASESKMMFVPYGFDPKRFRPITDARQKLLISENTLQLLYVGRLSH